MNKVSLCEIETGNLLFHSLFRSIGVMQDLPVNLAVEGSFLINFALLVVITTPLLLCCDSYILVESNLLCPGIEVNL